MAIACCELNSTEDDDSEEELDEIDEAIDERSLFALIMCAFLLVQQLASGSKHMLHR